MLISVSVSVALVLEKKYIDRSKNDPNEQTEDSK